MRELKKFISENKNEYMEDLCDIGYAVQDLYIHADIELFGLHESILEVCDLNGKIARGKVVNRREYDDKIEELNENLDRVI